MDNIGDGNEGTVAAKKKEFGLVLASLYSTGEATARLCARLTGSRRSTGLLQERAGKNEFDGNSLQKHTRYMHVRTICISRCDCFFSVESMPRSMDCTNLVCSVLQILFLQYLLLLASYLVHDPVSNLTRFRAVKDHHAP